MSARLLFGLFASLLVVLVASDTLAQISPEKEAAAKELLAKNGIEVEGNFVVTQFLHIKTVAA